MEENNKRVETLKKIIDYTRPSNKKVNWKREKAINGIVYNCKFNPLQSINSNYFITVDPELSRMIVYRFTDTIEFGPKFNSYETAIIKDFIKELDEYFESIEKTNEDNLLSVINDELRNFKVI
jgi:hypothetical protein